ncbi:MAG: tripartite tricarboxylate transporter substrate binding protein, partial [Betaproteobacteria bacterium]|nr:tripartite tricarboxylate transporter substrate binding protein [Betaproteobacteria bacterium]
MRQRTAIFIFTIGLLTGHTAPVVAQDTAPKMIRIVVPFSPGASNDAIARTIAGPLAKRLDATVIVENKPGASGIIGADLVAKSSRDGSVLLLTSSTFLTAAATQSRLPFDPIASFSPVATVGQNPSLLAVSAATPFKTPA